MISPRPLLVLSISMFAIHGCGYLDQPTSATFLLAAREGVAYFEYYDNYSGFETLPSAPWQLDRETGAAKRVAGKAVRYATRIAGEYLVFARPNNKDGGSQIVAKPIDGGPEVVILNRDVELGGRYFESFAVDEAQRVVAHSQAGLLVYNPAESRVERDIAVDADIDEIYAAGNGWAVITVVNESGVVSNHLFNLDTGERRDLPEEVMGYYPLMFDAKIVGDTLFTGGFSVSVNTADAWATLSLDLLTFEWNVLARYDLDALALEGAHVGGADSQRVMVNRISLQRADIEVIDRQSGEHTIIEEVRGFLVEPIGAVLSDGHAIWISGDELIDVDLSTLDRTTLALPTGGSH